MSQETSTILVPFHGDQITCVETPDGVFVAIKPICERLGLASNKQIARLKRSQERYGGTAMVLPSGRGAQETFCIPASKVFGWLATITVSRVKPEVRDALIAYQNEADAVLDRHFRLKAAKKDAEIAHLQDQLACCHAFLGMFNPKWNTIRLLLGRQTSYPTIARRVNMTMTGVEEAREEMRDCGIEPMFRTRGTAAPALNERIRNLEIKLWSSEKRLSEATGQSSLFEDGDTTDV